MAKPGDVLRQLRERRGMTKYRLHELTGISHSNLFTMEAGVRHIGVHHIAALIPALDLAVDEIEDLIRAVSEERTADLDDLLQREYVRLYPNGIVKGAHHA